MILFYKELGICLLIATLTICWRFQSSQLPQTIVGFADRGSFVVLIGGNFWANRVGNLARLQPFTVDTTYVTLLCDSEEPFLQLIVTLVSALQNIQELFIRNRSTEWNYWLLIGRIWSLTMLTRRTWHYFVIMKYRSFSWSLLSLVTCRTYKNCSLRTDPRSGTDYWLLISCIRSWTLLTVF